MEHTRCSIDIQGLKQLFWERLDGISLDKLLAEHICENARCWIDTFVMIVDCLLKKTYSDVLLRLMSAGKLSLEASVEAQMLKLRKHKF